MVSQSLATDLDEVPLKLAHFVDCGNNLGKQQAANSAEDSRSIQSFPQRTFIVHLYYLNCTTTSIITHLPHNLPNTLPKQGISHEMPR